MQGGHTEKVLAEYDHLFHLAKHSYGSLYRTQTNKCIISFDHSAQYFQKMSRTPSVNTSNTFKHSTFSGCRLERDQQQQQKKES